MQDDSSRFEVSGDTLRIFSVPDTSLVTGAVVIDYSSFARTGKGQGLDGLWKAVGQGYRVASGALTAEEKAERDRDARVSDAGGKYGDTFIRLTGTRATAYADIDYARQFVDRWNGIDEDNPINVDSSRYAIGAKAVARNLVEMKGRIAAETVRVQYHPNGDIEYTSDSAGHGKHVYRADPTTCPNAHSPEWYFEFRQANQNPLE